MPLYEYECDACGHCFEAIRKFADPPLEECPKCGGPLRKLQSAPAFHLKGTGWYITDYAKKDQTSAGKSEEGGKGAASGGDAAAKADKAEKAEKADKAEKSEKTEKAGTSAPGSDSSPASSTSTTPKKE